MKTPKIFKKNPKKLSQMHEMHEKEGLGPLLSEEKLDLGQKILEDEVWRERERGFRRRRGNMSQEISREIRFESR